MAKMNPDEFLQKALERVKETFKEELRLLQEQAWAKGYQACKEGKQQFRNPYRPPSDSDGPLDRENLG